MPLDWTNSSLVAVNFPFRASKNPSSYCSILINFIKGLQFFTLFLLVVCLMPSNWYPMYLAFYHIGNCGNRPTTGRHLDWVLPAPGTIWHTSGSGFFKYFVARPHACFRQVRGIILTKSRVLPIPIIACNWFCF